MSETNTQRNYKDTIFRMLFREKENLLSLYNALNHTAYTNVDDLEITTLEYAQYVEQVRIFAREESFPEAVEHAVDYCIENGILSEFLSKNRAEAIAVCIFEYDEEKHMKQEREEWQNIGREEILVKSVESVMESFCVDLQEACRSLRTTVSEYEKAKEHLQSIT
ncbi:MAG: hypothetical protein K2N77_09480 [Lachnospiraceae bacterium]|nr:hypothetical protein [Lachnospiraceae bacterium]